MILLLCDENLPLPSINFLRAQGYDVTAVAELYPGATDEEVIAVSAYEERVIITFDSDFGTLIFRNSYRPHGVIYFRLPSFRPSEPGILLHDIIQSERLDLVGYLTVFSDQSIRQRKIPAP